MADFLELLAREGVVDAEQVKYARRVASKLDPPRPMSEVLCDLGHTTEERIHAVLVGRRVELPLSDLLFELGFLARSDVEQAEALRDEDPESKRSLGDVLLEHDYVSEEQLYTALAYQMGRAFVRPAAHDIDRKVLAGAPPAWCRQNRVLPIGNEGESVVVATGDPDEIQGLRSAEQIFGEGRVIPVMATPTTIDAVWNEIDPQQPAGGRGTPEDAQAVSAVDATIMAAIERDVSDIHVEPLVDRLRIRFREDGVLVPYRDFPDSMKAGFTSRIKVLCKANIAEKRRHQGGRIEYTHAKGSLDLRVSFYVTVHGEKVVLRLLNRERPLLPLAEIGMPPRVLERFTEDALSLPSGVILVTGPTGSGKTSTLYSSIHHINNPETAIITAEDPVEYMIDGIAQCSLNPEIDLTFEETLRHIVRQDPDVIVIGEIRDRFSAETAIQAALTGHKVITTFHTEDTIGGLVRLLNMNIEAFLISSTVVSVLAQRLVRRVCEVCAVPYTPTAADLRRLGYTGTDLEGAEMRMGRGCTACRRTGYKGRVAIFELLVLGEELRDALLEHKTSHEIRRISLERNGFVSLLEDGIMKAAKGLTTVNECIRMLPRLDPPRPLHELRRLLGE